MKPYKKISKETRFMLAVLLAGFAVRLWGIADIPGGLNQDEASIGYEAFAIATKGFDRNGVANPVHLIAWGSGQNIAYAWLCIPFIKILGLSVLSVRLPMAVAGCISVVVFRLMFREMYGEKAAAVAAVFFAIFPWHIMKSRWALESNIFPDLVLWGACLLVFYISRQKPVFLYSAVFLLAFSVYSYGTAYMFMPLFAAGVWLYMACSRKIKPKDFLLSAGLFFVLVLPMLLFVYINITGGESIHLLGFTIPRMHQQRFSTVTRTGSLYSVIEQGLKGLWNILKNQGDGLPWNSLQGYGICYLCFVPLIFTGMAVSIKKKGRYTAIMHIWAATALITALVTDINVNRVNIIFIPVGWYIAVALSQLAIINKKTALCVTTVCCGLFAIFCGKYFTGWADGIKHHFFYSFQPAIETARRTDAEKIYIDIGTNRSYILTAFYTQADPVLYTSTVQTATPGAAFEQISSFDRYIFCPPENLPAPVDTDCVYLTTYEKENIFDENIFIISRFEKYIVATPLN